MNYIKALWKWLFEEPANPHILYCYFDCPVVQVRQQGRCGYTDKCSRCEDDPFKPGGRYAQGS